MWEGSSHALHVPFQATDGGLREHPLQPSTHSHPDVMRQPEMQNMSDPSASPLQFNPQRFVSRFSCVVPLHGNIFTHRHLAQQTHFQFFILSSLNAAVPDPPITTFVLTSPISALHLPSDTQPHLSHG